MKNNFLFISPRKLFAVAALFFVASELCGEASGRGRKSKEAGRFKEVSVRYVEEHRNGHLFAHRVDVVDGRRKEKWAVDGTVVTGEEYEEALLDAEKAERRSERRKDEALRVKEELDLAQHQEFFCSSKVTIEKKRLQLLLAKIDEELGKLRDAKLVPYYSFGDTTFADAKSYEQFCEDLLVQARHCAEAEKMDLDEVRNMVASLESQPARLRLFFRATVNNAIEHCNDTRLLKELLDVLA